MSRLDFKLPDIGEGVTEGEIVEWFVRPGQSIAEDDPMVEVMTDKATVTIGAPCDARVEELRFEAGQVAKVGQVILTLSPAAGASSSLPAASAVGQIDEELPGIGLMSQGQNGHGQRNGNGGTRRRTARPAMAAQRRALRTSPTAGGEISYFEAGHMMYIHRDSLERLAAELKAFVTGGPE